MTLAEFLLARIEEDEFMALATIRLVAEAEASQGDTPMGQPSRRAIVECEMKRRIVEQYEAVRAAAPRALDSGEYPFAHALEMVMRFLASVYADHPDYREEWRP